MRAMRMKREMTVPSSVGATTDYVTLRTSIAIMFTKGCSISNHRNHRNVHEVAPTGSRWGSGRTRRGSTWPGELWRSDETKVSTHSTSAMHNPRFAAVRDASETDSKRRKVIDSWTALRQKTTGEGTGCAKSRQQGEQSRDVHNGVRVTNKHCVRATCNPLNAM